MKKICSSLLLTFVIMIIFISCSSAITDSTLIPLETSFDDALAAALEDNQVSAIRLTLSRDSIVTKHFEIDKPLTIVLNGFDLTLGKGLKTRPFDVVTDNIKIEIDGRKTGSTLRVSPEDATTEEQNYGIFEINGNNIELFLNGGNYLGNTDKGALIKIYEETGEQFKQKIFNTSILIENTIINTNSNVISMDSYTLDTFKLNVENSKITISNDTPSSRGNVFFLDNYDAKKVNAYFNSVDIQTDGAIPVEASGLWTEFQNCNFKVTTAQAKNSWTPVAISASYEGKTDVESGTFHSEKYGVYIYSSGGKVNIKDGVTISGTEAAIYATNMNNTDTSAVVNISGGKIIGAVINKCDNSTSKIIITGGEFDGKLESTCQNNLVIKGGTFTVDPSTYVPEGYKVMNTDGNTWTVVQDQ